VTGAPPELEELAALADVHVSDVRNWTDVGLLDPRSGEPDRLRQRARLLGLAARRGIDVTSIAAACERDPGLLERFDRLVVRAGGQRLPIAEAARAAGLDPEFAHRLRLAGGIGLDGADEDDLAAMRAARTALDVGLPAEAVLQLARVFADSLGRVADAEIRLFHFHVHERLRAQGSSDADVAAATDAATDALVSLMEPSITYFHRKAWQAALQEDLLAHFAAQVSGPGQPVNQLAVAVLFVDLASFTPLTDAMGDVAAVEVVDRFADMVREEAALAAGRVVKQIGDEFMLVFPTAAQALRFAVHLAARAARTPRFPALRIGANFGSALYREADYLGATVNIAARVTAVADPGVLIVTDDFRTAAGDAAVGFEPLGSRTLKGVAEPVGLHRLHLDSDDVAPRDPVCGMRLGLGSGLVATSRGMDYEFCSEDCRDRFEADPARYALDLLP
jgi:adenylate cyclase